MADREGVVDLAPDLSFHGARLARAALGRACHPNGKVVEDPTPMKRTIQVRIFRGEQKYVAECLDLPVVTEAATLDELAANIREAISLHLEGEDLAAMGLSEDPTILATMELPAVA
jgi:predicted RNase H-like HicB family nuclease